MVAQDKRSAGSWSPPTSPWILHVTRVMGAIDGFVDVQTRGRRDFDSRLLGMRVEHGDVTRQPYWLVAADRFVDYLALRAAHATGGRSAVLLARRFASNPPRVLHGHYGPVAAQLPRLARTLHAPLVASFYGYDTSLRTYIDSPRWLARYRRLFRDVAAVLAEGPALAAKLEALGCPAAKLHVIRLPANEERLAECRRVRPDRFVVSAAGRFVEKKGFDTAIRAFAKALRGTDARLVLVGGGELEPVLRQLARDERVDEQVEWRGRLPFVDFTNAAAAASVAVFPSRRAANGDAEGGGLMTLIELQWLGVPAILSDHDDLPFTAAPELPVLPPTDVGAWADLLRAFYDDASPLEALGEAGRRFAQAHHSVAQNTQERELVYADVSS